MMKRFAVSLAVLLLLSPLLHAGYADGLISAGEYEGGVEWFSGTLVVNGGGADEIFVRNSARLKVLSTSSPLGLYVGGIMDIFMDDNSILNYYGGLTQELTMYSNATANLYGGRIDGISSAQYTIKTGSAPHINLYCQPGWSWTLSGQNKVGITGLWMDNSAFNIHFTNNFQEPPPFNADPVWTNINVIPEPATLILLGCGVLLLRKRYVSKFVSQKKETAIKGIFPVLLMCLCVSVSLAGYSDGFITEGEYEYMAEVFYDDVLIVEGGGADLIYMWGNSQLEVRYTSTPLSDNSGIQEIRLCANSRLDYHGGVTDKILFRDNSTAYLYGGQINSLESWQPADAKHIHIYCQTGWSWLYDSAKKVGITGLWAADNTAFSIDFIDSGFFGSDPVWENINVVEIPEPATLLLLGLGGLLLRRKR